MDFSHELYEIARITKIRANRPSHLHHRCVARVLQFWFVLELIDIFEYIVSIYKTNK